MATHDDVASYLAAQPEGTRAVLERIRAVVHEVAPDAEDVIRYDIPTASVAGRSLVHYAGWKKHVSLYPLPAGDDALTADLASYAAGKGTLKFPLDDPPSDALLRRVVTQLLAQHAR